MDDLSKATTTVPTSRPCTHVCRHDNHNNSRTVSPSPWLQSLHKPKIFQVPVLLFIILISSSNVSGRELNVYILKDSLKPPFQEHDPVTFTCTANVLAETLQSGQTALTWSLEGGLPAEHDVVPSKQIRPNKVTHYESQLTFRPTAREHGKALICKATVGTKADESDPYVLQVDFSTTTATTPTTTITTTASTTSTTERATEPPEDNQWHPYLMIGLGGLIGLVLMIPVFWLCCPKRKPGATATPQPQQPLVMAPTSSFMVSSLQRSFMIPPQPQQTMVMAPQQSMMMQSPEQRGTLMGRGSPTMSSMMAAEAPLSTQPNGDAPPHVLNQPTEMTGNVSPDLGFYTADQYPQTVENSNQQRKSLEGGSIWSRFLDEYTSPP